MEEPSYILRFNSTMTRETNYHPLLTFARKCNWVACLCLCGYGVLFSGISFTDFIQTYKHLFIIFGFLLFFLRKKNELCPSPIEARFYEDYLVIYEKKYQYSRKEAWSREYKYYYKDITECYWRPKVNKIGVTGAVEAIMFNYNQDGTLQTIPSRHKKVEEGGTYLYTDFSKDVNFAKEIEAHSPIKVEILDY